MVGIIVDDDVVAVPKPVVAEADVIGGDAEIEATEPEAIGTASCEMPNVAAAKAAGEVSVLPGVIEVVVRIVWAGVVADPFAVGVDVRRVGMTGLVVEVTVFLGGSGMRSTGRSRAMGGNVGGSTTDLTMMLSKCYYRKQKADRERSDSFSHVRPFVEQRKIVVADGGWGN